MEKGKFRKYNLKEIVTIGRANDVDIYLDYPFIEKYHAEIHFKDTIRIVGCKNLIFKIEQHGSSLSMGDSIRFLDIVIVYHPYFLMINKTMKSSVNIQKYISNSAIYVEKYNKVNFVKKYRQLSLRPVLQIELKSFETVQSYKQIHLIFSMGPALTMSVASLMSGLFSMYNAYMQGRALIEVMPMLLLPCMMLISTCIYHPIQRVYEKNRKLKEEKNRFNKIATYIKTCETEIDTYRQELNAYFDDCFIEYREMSEAILNDHDMLWCKNENHEDYLWIGLGKGISKLPVVFKNIPNQEDIYTEKITALLNQLDSGVNSWIYHNFNIEANLLIIDRSYQFYKYILLQFIYYYGIDVIKIIFFLDEENIKNMEDIKWIPHTYIENDTRILIIHSSAMVYEINKILRKCKEKVICFIQDVDLFSNCTLENIINIFMYDDIDSANNSNMPMVVVNEKESLYRKSDNTSQLFNFDNCDIDFHSIYIKLLNLSSNKKSVLSIHSTISIFRLFGIRQCSELAIQDKWSKNIASNGLKTIIGINEKGENLYVDLHENANGPHMMIGSTTGGGKSEFLITFALSLAIHYSPQQVQFSIIDFKGGGLADSLKSNGKYLPHLVGNITNLNHNEMERALCSFDLECKHRQELFVKMSQYLNEPSMNIDKYQNYYDKKYGLPFLAHLIIIVDEFAELKKYEPDFMKDLISISRIGRSLGVHLVLSTQKPANVVDPEMWSNCRTKVCLKVQDKQDSMEMLHLDKAYYLTQPGQFYMLVDNHCQLGKSAWSNVSVYEHEHDEKVFIVDNYGNKIKKNTKKLVQGETQLTYLIDEINKCKYEKVEQLWYDSLPKLSWKDMTKEVGILGVIDDYFNKRQIQLTHNFEKNEHGIIFASNHNEKIKFFNTVMISIITTLRDVEVFIIDPTKSSNHQFEKVGFVQYVDNREKIVNLFNLLLKNEDNNKNKRIILIYQYTSFCEELEGYELLYKYLQESTTINSLCLLFANQVNSVHYRILSMIQCRYCLMNQSASEISSIFETVCRQTISDEDFGILKRDKLLLFRMIHTTSEDIDIVLNKFSYFNIVQKTTIPYIPDKLIYEGLDKNILGMDCNSYQWIKLDEYQFTICISKFISKLKEFISKNFGHIKICTTSDEFSDVNIIFENDFEMVENITFGNSKYIVCIEEKKWSQSWVKTMNEDKSLIWVGQGFRNQLIIPNPSYIDSNNNELIYAFEGSIHRIKEVDIYD